MHSRRICSIGINDLDAGSDRKLKIQPNSFTDWVLKDQGQERNIVTHFQRYTSHKLTPHFNEAYNEITFSIEGGNEEIIDNIKISRGEESCLIWCVFYSLQNRTNEKPISLMTCSTFSLTTL